MDCSSDTFNKAKRNAKDPRSFPLSLMKPKMADRKSSSTSSDPQTSGKTDILRQRPVQRAKLGRFSSDALADPLSAIEQIKTEESIQEWLARISESVGPEDGERSAWGGRKERQETAKSNKLLRTTEIANVLNKGLQVRTITPTLVTSGTLLIDIKTRGHCTVSYLFSDQIAVVKRRELFIN